MAQHYECQCAGVSFAIADVGDDRSPASASFLESNQPSLQGFSKADSYTSPMKTTDSTGIP